MGVPSLPPAVVAGTIAGVEHEPGGPDFVSDPVTAPVIDSVTYAVVAPAPDAVVDPVTDAAAPTELDIDVSVLDAIEGELADVERALALIDEGTYGRCDACGGAIDDAVLARAPTARFCAQHLPLALR